MSTAGRPLTSELIQAEVARHVEGYPNLALAFSGGMDSTVLLHVLHHILLSGENLPAKIGPTSRLRAIHVNHGLSERSRIWAAHCAAECRRRGVTFQVLRADGISGREGGIQASARRARYRALGSVLEAGEVLLTAHHQDDQVETFLLALKRGSGPRGLAGMQTRTPFSGSYLIRPLLGFGRDSIRLYALERQLSWIEDESNTDLRFDRNFLRLIVLPLLKERWRCFPGGVIRSSRFCAGQENLVEDLLSDRLDSFLTPDGSVNLDLLGGSTPGDSHLRILRHWLMRSGLESVPSLRRLAILWREVVLSRNDSRAQFTLGKDHLVRRFRGRLYLLHRRQILRREIDQPLVVQGGQGSVLLPADLGEVCYSLVSSDETSAAVMNQTGQPHPPESGAGSWRADGPSLTVVRAPREDEQVSIRMGVELGKKLQHIPGRSRGRSLRKIWQELGVPPWERYRIPLLFYDDNLIAALDIFTTREGDWRNGSGEQLRLAYCPRSPLLSTISRSEGREDGRQG